MSRTKSIERAILVKHTIGNVLMFEYQPGNGTRYFVHITDLRAMCTAPPTIQGHGHPVYTVGLYTEGHGTCMTVQGDGSYLAASYVAEKLKVGLGDASVLAEAIAHFTGRKADKVGP